MVCANCGEEYLDASTTEQVQRAAERSVAEQFAYWDALILEAAVHVVASRPALLCPLW